MIRTNEWQCMQAAGGGKRRAAGSGGRRKCPCPSGRASDWQHVRTFCIKVALSCLRCVLV